MASAVNKIAYYNSVSPDYLWSKTVQREGYGVNKINMKFLLQNLKELDHTGDEGTHISFINFGVDVTAYRFQHYSFMNNRR
jgi:hypothetical protein